MSSIVWTPASPPLARPQNSGLADEYSPGAERDSLERVHPAPDAGVEIDLKLVAHGVGYLGERLDAGAGAIELPGRPVIGYDYGSPRRTRRT